MKKLIIFNHLGEKELEFDVFMEGQDFVTSFPTPKCVWLGQIVIMDKEPEPQPRPEIEPEFETQRFEEHEKEVKHEPETVSNQSSRDSGIGTPEQLESLEKLPEKHTRGQARKRSKRV